MVYRSYSRIIQQHDDETLAANATNIRSLLHHESSEKCAKNRYNVPLAASPPLSLKSPPSGLLAPSAQHGKLDSNYTSAIPALHQSAMEIYRMKSVQVLVQFVACVLQSSDMLKRQISPVSPTDATTSR